MRITIFDALGFLALVSVGAKLILKEISRTGIEWDDKLPPAFESHGRIG